MEERVGQATGRAARVGTALKATATEFLKDNCTQLAAAISYYAVFSMPAVLVIVVSVAGLFVQPEDIRGEIAAQLQVVFGSEGKELINNIVEQANLPGRGIVGAVVGIAILMFGATGVMVQLQASLNQVWSVKPDPDQSSIRPLVVKRLLSIGMVLGIAFLLLVSLFISAVLASLGRQIGAVLPFDSSWLPAITHLVVDWMVATLLFSAMYKWMPDAKIRWRDVTLGASIAALLFLVGKYLLGLYFGNAQIGSAYGAAGSLALLMAWVYYSGLIFLAGAEFTKAWARVNGRQLTPDKGAVRVD